MAVCTILLIAPAAYHRIVEAGEDSEQFHGFAGRMLLAAMVFLALGVTGDFLVILLSVFRSRAVALSLATALLLFFFGLWFGSTVYIRMRREHV